MLTKIKLFYQIKKFYKIFGDEVGSNFITKLSDVTTDNVGDVLFDINEVFDDYDNDNTDRMTVWINKFRTQVIKFYCTEQHTKGYTLLRVCLAICHHNKCRNNGQLSYAMPFVKLANWLIKKGGTK